MHYKVLKIITVFFALFGFLPISLSIAKGKLFVHRSKIWQTYQYLYTGLYVVIAVDLAVQGFENFKYSTDTWMSLSADGIYCIILLGMLISVHIHRSSILEALGRTIELSTELPENFWMKTTWFLVPIVMLLSLLAFVTNISAFFPANHESFSIKVLLRRKMPFSLIVWSIFSIFTFSTTVLSIISCYWNHRNAVLSQNISSLKAQLQRFKELANLCEILGRSYGFTNLLFVMLMFFEFVFNLYELWAIPCRPLCVVAFKTVQNVCWLLCIVYMVVQKLKVISDVVYESKRTCQILTLYDSLEDYVEKAEEFTMHCLHSPITFNCCGFFELNFPLLGNVLCAIATNTLIMIQMR